MSNPPDGLIKYPARGKLLPGKRDGLMQDIALFPGVQAEIDAHAIAIGLHAELKLEAIRANPEYTGGGDFTHASIHVSKGKIDSFISLQDNGGTHSNGAAAIEYGRAGYFDPHTGEKYGATRPAWILHDAAGIGRKGRKARLVKVKVRKRSVESWARAQRKKVREERKRSGKSAR